MYKIPSLKTKVLTNEGTENAKPYSLTHKVYVVPFTLFSNPIFLRQFLVLSLSFPFWYLTWTSQEANSQTVTSQATRTVISRAAGTVAHPQ